MRAELFHSSVTDSDGTTCLHIAATLSNAPLAQLLLDTELPLEIDQQDFAGGSTALHMAVTPDDPSKAEAAARFVALLLESGADATVRDKAGKVASDYAELAPVRAALSVTNSPPVGGRRRRIATPTTDEPPAGGSPLGGAFAVAVASTRTPGSPRDRSEVTDERPATDDPVRDGALAAAAAAGAPAGSSSE